MPREIVFTSGGTEANNLAIKGAAWAGKARGHRIITTTVEHHSVGHTVRYLEKFGFEIVEVPVDRFGLVNPDDIEAAITSKTVLVSVMLANNEVGTIQPLAEIAARVRRHKGVLLHTDAVQAAPYLPINLQTLDVDLLTIAAHKFEGPKGVGVLFVRSGTNILAQQQGGAQERYRRAGTENVAGAAGLARALELAVAEQPETAARIRGLRDALNATVMAAAGVDATGHSTERLPGLASYLAPGLDGNAVTMALDLAGLACSTGSACVSGSREVSHVLTAMGYTEVDARGALRISLGRNTTAPEVAEAGNLIVRTLGDQREAAEKLAAARALGRASAPAVGALARAGSAVDSSEAEASAG
jgi:cysteine desulfurase